MDPVGRAKGHRDGRWRRGQNESTDGDFTDCSGLDHDWRETSATSLECIRCLAPRRRATVTGATGQTTERTLLTGWATTHAREDRCATGPGETLERIQVLALPEALHIAIDMSGRGGQGLGELSGGYRLLHPAIAVDVVGIESQPRARRERLG